MYLSRDTKDTLKGILFIYLFFNLVAGFVFGSAIILSSGQIGGITSISKDMIIAYLLLSEGSPTLILTILYLGSKLLV